MTPGSFESAKVLINRVKTHHLRDFEVKEAWFASKKPYDLFSEKDQRSGMILMKARIRRPIPGELSAIAFDIVNELRSSLDHVVFDSAVLLGGDPSPKYTKFPFGKSPEQAENDLRRQHSEVPESLWPFLLGFEPHKGGKESLWELNELRNHKIHKILVGFLAASGGVGFGGRIEHVRFDAFSEWDSSKGELTYMRIAPGAKLKGGTIDPRIKVAFGEDTEFANQSAFRVLCRMTEVVDRIVKGIEAEAFRLHGLQNGTQSTNRGNQ